MTRGTTESDEGGLLDQPVLIVLGTILLVVLLLGCLEGPTETNQRASVLIESNMGQSSALVLSSESERTHLEIAPDLSNDTLHGPIIFECDAEELTVEASITVPGEKKDPDWAWNETQQQWTTEAPQNLTRSQHTWTLPCGDTTKATIPYGFGEVYGPEGEDSQAHIQDTDPRLYTIAPTPRSQLGDPGRIEIEIGNFSPDQTTILSTSIQEGDAERLTLHPQEEGQSSAIRRATPPSSEALHCWRQDFLLALSSAPLGDSERMDESPFLSSDTEVVSVTGCGGSTHEDCLLSLNVTSVSSMNLSPDSRCVRDIPEFPNETRWRKAVDGTRSHVPAQSPTCPDEGKPTVTGSWNMGFQNEADAEVEIYMESTWGSMARNTGPPALSEKACLASYKGITLSPNSYTSLRGWCNEKVSPLGMAIRFESGARYNYETVEGPECGGEKAFQITSDLEVSATEVRDTETGRQDRNRRSTDPGAGSTDGSQREESRSGAGGGETEVLLDSWTNDARRTLKGSLGSNWDESDQSYHDSTRWTMDPKSSDGTTWTGIECVDEDGDGYAPVDVIIFTPDDRKVYGATHRVPCYDGGNPRIDVYVSPSYEVSVDVSEAR